MKQDKNQKSEVGQEARDAWARALLKSADKHNDERLRGLANEISSETKERKLRGIKMLRYIALLANIGSIIVLIGILFVEFPRYPEEIFGVLAIFLFLILNVVVIFSPKQSESLFGLWLEVRKKKLRKQLEED